MASLLLLSACEQPNESGRISVDGAETNASFTPPTQLLSTRSIVRENLILEITIGGDTSVVEPNASGVYVFTTTRPVNSSTTVTIVWSELIDGELLPLARATKRLDVGSASSALALTFDSTEFDTTSDDADGDGFSNYLERRDGEEGAFNDPNSPESPPVIVTVEVQLALPVDMRDATAERRAAVTAKALVNSETISLSRDGDVWTGSTTVTANTEPLVTATFFALADEKTEIASLARSQNIGGGGLIVFNEGDYDVEFNDDGDDFSNIQETAIGSNPRDSNDPRAPVANAGSDVTITSGGTVTLNGSASSSDSNGSISTFRWTEGSNDLGAGVSLVVSGLGIGPHEIELRVTDNLGLTDTDTVVVTVTAATVPNQAPVASAGADQTVASGVSVTLDGSGSSDTDGTITYRWTENGATLANAVRPVIGILADGQHTITLTVTDNDGETDTDTVVITVTAAPPENMDPVAEAGVGQVIDSGDPVTLDGSDSSDSDGTIDSYEWTEGSTTLGSGRTLVVSDLSDGPHTITLEVTDNDGATDTDTVTVQVSEAPPVPNEDPVADAGVDQTVDSGEPVTLDGSDSSDEEGPIATYRWTENSTFLGNGEMLVVTDLTDGEHGITLTVTDSVGATASDEVTITVTEAEPEPEPEAPEANAGEDQNVGSGESVLLDGVASSDPDGTIESYEWSDDVATLGTGVSLVIDDLAEGEHEFTLLVTDNDELTDTDTVSVSVTAIAEPDVLPVADAGFDQIINFGEPVTLSGIGSSDEDGVIASYQWSDELEMVLSDEVTLELSDLSAGEYEFTLLVTDDDELTGTDTVSVTVTATGEAGDEGAPVNDRDNLVDGVNTSATGEFFAPIRTLA